MVETSRKASKNNSTLRLLLKKLPSQPPIERKGPGELSMPRTKPVRNVRKEMKREVRKLPVVRTLLPQVEKQRLNPTEKQKALVKKVLLKRKSLARNCLVASSLRLGREKQAREALIHDLLESYPLYQL